MLRSSKKGLPGVGVGRIMQACSVLARVPGTLLQNLLLWWNLSATPQVLRFFFGRSARSERCLWHGNVAMHNNCPVSKSSDKRILFVIRAQRMRRILSVPPFFPCPSPSRFAARLRGTLSRTGRRRTFRQRRARPDFLNDAGRAGNSDVRCRASRPCVKLEPSRAVARPRFLIVDCGQGRDACGWLDFAARARR